MKLNYKNFKVLLMVVLSHSVFAGTANATEVRNYNVPKPGILWITVDPEFIDYRKYYTKFHIKTDRYYKKIKYKKAGDQPVTVAIPILKAGEKVKLTIYDGSFKAIKVGYKPRYKYDTEILCDKKRSSKSC